MSELTKEERKKTVLRSMLRQLQGLAVNKHSCESSALDVERLIAADDSEQIKGHLLEVLREAEHRALRYQVRIDELTAEIEELCHD